MKNANRKIFSQELGKDHDDRPGPQPSSPEDSRFCSTVKRPILRIKSFLCKGRAESNISRFHFMQPCHTSDLDGMPGRARMASPDLEVVDLVSEPDANVRLNLFEPGLHRDRPINGKDARDSLDFTNEHLPSIVMLDHRSPKRDGHHVRQALYNVEDWITCPESDTIDRATAMGVFGAEQQSGLHLQNNRPDPSHPKIDYRSRDDHHVPSKFLAKGDEPENLGNRAYYDASSHVSRAPEKEADTIETQCLNGVLAVFPDICTDYVSGLFEDGKGTHADQLVVHILDHAEKTGNYPKAKVARGLLKRKRELNEDEEAIGKYDSDRNEPSTHIYSMTTRAALAAEFPFTPMAFVNAILEQSRGHLFPAYRILEEAERTWNAEKPPYNKIKTARRSDAKFQYEKLMSLNDPSAATEMQSALEELRAAQTVRCNAENKRLLQKQAELKEEENTRRAQEEGTMMECGCCFSEYPLNRMVHCNSKEALHWFCQGCARRTAETEVGNSKYEICCMSMDGCKAGFSMQQRAQFLDENLTIALDRNEQEAVLRMAGIENLASCPFCPFAAEYPPVEENKLFQCQNPECEKLTCRLCKLESHIPKTCKEHAKEAGLSVRRQIEEAMSAALIRRCNKCNTPFVKDEGCNKMTCTRNGCHNVQCYVCSKSCTYDHFDDTGRGGKRGNCPLFESADERHEREVSQAEKEALAKARADHPQYSDEDLRITMSEDVQRDEEKRRKGKAAIPHIARNLAQPPHLHIQQPVGRPPAVQRRDIADVMPRIIPGWIPPIIGPPRVEAAENGVLALNKRGPAPNCVPAPLMRIPSGPGQLGMPKVQIPVGGDNVALNPGDATKRKENTATHHVAMAQQQAVARMAQLAAQRDRASREIEEEARRDGLELAALERDVLRAQEAYRVRVGVKSRR